MKVVPDESGRRNTGNRDREETLQRIARHCWFGGAGVGLSDVSLALVVYRLSSSGIGTGSSCSNKSIITFTYDVLPACRRTYTRLLIRRRYISLSASLDAIAKTSSGHPSKLSLKSCHNSCRTPLLMDKSCTTIDSGSVYMISI